MRRIFYYLFNTFYWLTVMPYNYLCQKLLAAGIAENFAKSSLAASIYGKGIGVYSRKDYPGALKLFKTISDYNVNTEHVSYARYYIAVMYYSGLDVEKNISQAKVYLRGALDSSDGFNSHAKELLTAIETSEDE